MSTVETLYRFQHEQGYSVITFLPTINDAQLASIDAVGGEVVQRFDQSRSPALIVDLSKLNYIGSAMVAAIVKIWKAVKALNGRMVVQANNAMVLEVLRIAGLQQIWTIVPTREDALRSLGLSERRDSTGNRVGGRATGAPLWAVVLGVVALLAAVGGLLLYFYQTELFQRTVLPGRTALLVAVISGAMGLILGTVATVLGTGGRRIAGAVVVVGCLVTVVIGVVKLSESDLVPNNPIQVGGQISRPDAGMHISDIVGPAA